MSRATPRRRSSAGACPQGRSRQASGSEADIPKACIYYNMEKGCSWGEKCWFLHVCRHLLTGDCKFGDACKRSHDLLDNHNRAVLHSLYSDTDVRQKAEEILALVSTATGGSTTVGQVQSNSGGTTASCDSAGEVDEICIFDLRGRCGFGTNCRLHHKPAPFQWQYQDQASQQWVDIKANEVIEKKYCSTGIDGVNLNIQIGGQSMRKYMLGFHSMTLTCKGSGSLPVDSSRRLTRTYTTNAPIPVRRLGTISSVKKPPTFEYVTKWNWYWLDENNTWLLYGSQEATHVQCDVTVNDIEEAFLSGASNLAFSTTGGHKYDLSFKEMKQKNLKYGTERKVRRRPQLIDWKDKQQIVGTQASSQPKATGKSELLGLISSDIPEYWSTDNLDRKVQYIKLEKESAEFQNIETRFHATMRGHAVTNISRIQNLETYDAFYRKKQWMKRQSKKDPKELTLFHATKQENLKAISEQGFDCRISGSRTGTRYGKGTYFAKRASTSAKYCENKYRFLLVCQVLVGDVCQGMPRYVRPPPKDPKHPNENFYDSCVDKLDNPKKYVIFKPEQAYPEYVVSYK